MRDKIAWTVITFMLEHIASKRYRDLVYDVIGAGMHAKYRAKYDERTGEWYR